MGLERRKMSPCELVSTFVGSSIPLEAYRAHFLSW